MFLTPNSKTLLTFLTPKKEGYFIRVEIHQQQWNHEERHCRRPCLRSLLTFSAFEMSAYSRWVLIRGWALIWVNMVPSHLLVSDGFCNVSITGLWSKCYEVNQELMHTGTQCPGGGTWLFFGWVCAAWDSKLAPRSKKNSNKIDTPF